MEGSHKVRFDSTMSGIGTIINVGAIIAGGAMEKMLNRS